MKAINLIPDAAKKGFEAYLRKSEACLIGCFINETVFNLLLEGAISISQQTIEAHSITTNFLIIPPNLEHSKLISSQSWWGVEAIWIKDLDLSELRFGQLKPYLEIAGDDSSYLVITTSNSNHLVFKGILFLGTSIQTIKIHPEPGLNTHFINECVIMNINDNTVTLLVNNEPFLRVEKGELFEVQDFEEEISIALKSSTLFVENADKFAKELIENILRYASIRQIHFPRFPQQPDILDKIRVIIREVLRNIINTIATERHGATLVFGVPWAIDDESRFQPGGIQVSLPLSELIFRYISVFQFEGMLCVSNDDDLIQERDEKVLPEKLIAIQKAIINLSKTDGAIVFDKNLNLIGAGIFLKMASTVAGIGGARRKSAESFVKANPGVVALVISQDGNTCLFS